MKFSFVKMKQLADQLYRIGVTQKEPLSSFETHDGDGQWRTLQCPIVWGGARKTWHFRQSAVIPEAWRGGVVAIRFDIDMPKDRTACEALLYVNGRRSFGLDRNHKEYVLPAAIVRQGALELTVEAFAGITDNIYVYKAAQLCLLDPQTLDLADWLKNIAEALESMSENDPARHKVHDIAHRACLRVDLLAPRSDEYARSVRDALDLIVGGLASLPKDEFAPKMVAVGHSHIDIAYLWTIADARRKSVHTFTSVMALMERYPEFTYFQSMPQIYAYVEEDAPDLFAQIQQRAKEGRWEIEGGMWVESDCNVPSGESLVRQFMHGMRYAQEKFGKRCEILWMPDVFGYNAAMPQILRQCGIRYFMTTKLSWNEVNAFPHDTFAWKGIDGSQVLTYYISAPERNLNVYTYNGFLDPRSAAQLWDNYKSKAINDYVMIAYGHGDGGGGPTAEMIESGRRMQALPRLPQTKFGTALEFFRELERRMAMRDDLPVWKGELYLEFHRGTYTSQAKTKRFNRRSEWLYREAELWGAAADPSGSSAVQRKLDSGWKLILKNQFHDIIPGSGIPEVFEDSDRDYAQVLELGEAVLDESLTAIANRIPAEAGDLIVFNSLPWARSGWAEAGGSSYYVEDVPACGCKTVAAGELAALPKTNESFPGAWTSPWEPKQTAADCAVIAPAHAAGGNAGRRAASSPAAAWYVGTDALENELLRIEFTGGGQLASVWDKAAGREVLAPGQPGNVLELFEDRPTRNDCWNIDADFPLKSRVVTELADVRVAEDNGTTGSVQWTWRWNKSTIVQRVVIHRGKRRIDFDTRADWQERQVLLKAAFPVDVNSPVATYDIQFGNIQRSTLMNTSWDEAQFEMCAHKWADLSDGGYGVSLLNDCKYGYDIKGNNMRITLIKSGIYPDPQADRGEHAFCYSLYPHEGGWLQAGTNREAYELNVPLQAKFSAAVAAAAERRGSAKAEASLPAERSFAQLDSDHVMLETVKQAEDGRGIVVRCFEYGNRKGHAVIRLPGRPAQAAAVNLLEEETGGQDFELGADGSLSFPIAPYEIRTFRVIFD